MRHWVPEENKYYPCYCPTIKDDESQEKWRRTKCSDLTQEQKAQQEACLLSAAEWYESNYHRPYPFNYLIGREVSAHFIEPPAQPPPIEQYEQMRLF
ncbi:hypothetical protein CIG75_19150 [Tumebacillus algifaecis]|uniref:Uncharacterized protein n=1 Tax=Tumebacillus algifaecis TaxID=1214604 RepID=A0A223D5K7_9BACL|nr:hypothetical protein [Tumebacillus algifaecis]ASS76851.1 hypothetical protein CIG75_19150 [Tumebacillus algifaecis]